MENMEVQDRVVRLVDNIMVILAGSDVAEADTALSLTIVISICAFAPNDTAMRYQALEGFTRMISELIQREDLVDWIKASMNYSPRPGRA